ncbi:7,8-dihydropterin-6-yl-methyl-4-(beta-D-ribofuranosyl)aminobenzene 5'-phosphate synthase [Entomortierella parvispora]|uniref:7, 8-dihydropterin-6-yl-methyl-4-(Beta-D-ribofuranosyl)aminobenzene 5'-phosphate synthase n=1 Tax=Entomortierella parvispora TaxID=205924 RepID=A0A9P3HH85_9FUNG|nr:7,8-dihydropterin-6-yl-methyl-4-(beta-D-ribofuranosyl)aminobenzene 5'-phosphate synthase [Entomortierella parvispora]
MATPHALLPKGQEQDVHIQTTFPDLVELDALRLTVIVDNEVDIMTSVPKELGLTTQAQVLFKDKRHLDKEKSTATSTGAGAATVEHAYDHQASQGEGGPVRTIGFDFNDLCCGAHGLSILVTGIRGQIEHRILFDTGPHSAIFLENAKRLEIPFEKIETIVLSHWHVDHSGGMLAAVAKCVQARKDVKNGPDKKPASVNVDVHPDRPYQRGICLARPPPPSFPGTVHSERGGRVTPPGAEKADRPITSEYVAWKADPTIQELEAAGAKVFHHRDAHVISEGFFGVSGLIPRNTSYETGIPNHMQWSPESRCWVPDPDILDERYLVARVKGKGVVVLSGCSHAGIVNVCQDVQRAFGMNQAATEINQESSSSGDGNLAEVAEESTMVESDDDKGVESSNKLFYVVGGFHLAGSSVETRIAETVRDLGKISPSYLAPGHCSGWRAKAALENAMPGRVASLGVGSDFFITAPASSSKARRTRNIK